MARIYYIDFVKFIAILCVAIGHSVEFSLPNASGFELSVYSTIYSFHMPLFAFVSVLFLSFSGNVLIDLKKKALQLLLPYISWIFITFIIPEIFAKWYDSYKGIESFHVMAILRNIYFSITEWGYWFIRALFLCFIFALPCSGKFSNYWLLLSMFVVQLFSFFGVFPNHHISITGFIFLYPFFVTGKLISNAILVGKANKKMLVASALLWFVLIPFWRGMPDTFYGMNTSIFEPPFDPKYNVSGIIVVYKTLFRYLIGISGSIAIVLTIKSINSIKFWNNKIISLCCNIGKYTLIIYILNDYIIHQSVDMLQVEGTIRTVFLFIISLFSVVSVYYVGRLLGKNKYTSLFLLGKVPR